MSSKILFYNSVVFVSEKPDSALRAVHVRFTPRTDPFQILRPVDLRRRVASEWRVRYLRGEQITLEGETVLAVDVVIHLKGLSEYRPKPYNVNLLWMLSHPDMHTREELLRYDAVLVASLPHAARLERELPLPVIPLLQATDPEHFRPHPEVPR